MSLEAWSSSSSECTLVIRVSYIFEFCSLSVLRLQSCVATYSHWSRGYNTFVFCFLMWLEIPELRNNVLALVRGVYFTFMLNFLTQSQVRSRCRRSMQLRTLVVWVSAIIHCVSCCSALSIVKKPQKVCFRVRDDFSDNSSRKMMLKTQSLDVEGYNHQASTGCPNFHYTPHEC